MKKSLLLFLVVIVGVLIVGLPKQKDVNASSDVDMDIYEMIDEFYNDGNYTKKSNIYLEPIVLEELAKQGIRAFHGKVEGERQTYSTKGLLLI